MKDENAKEIGRIASFLIDSSGQVKDVLLENKNEEFVKYPLDRLKTINEEISLTTSLEKRAESLTQKIPILQKKRSILDKLAADNEVLPEIYENLCAEFDKALDGMKSEAKALLNEIEQEVQAQEGFIKTLHLARTYLEIEHGIGNVKDDVYQISLVAILKGIKNSSYRKLNLLKIKDSVSNILAGKEETQIIEEPKEQTSPNIVPEEPKPVIIVRMTQD